MINDKGEPKIADFGVASQITGLIGNDELAVGTPLFMYALARVIVSN